MSLDNVLIHGSFILCFVNVLVVEFDVMHDLFRDEECRGKRRDLALADDIFLHIGVIIQLLFKLMLSISSTTPVRNLALKLILYVVWEYLAEQVCLVLVVIIAGPVRLESVGIIIITRYSTHNGLHAPLSSAEYSHIFLLFLHTRLLGD